MTQYASITPDVTASDLPDPLTPPYSLSANDYAAPANNGTCFSRSPTLPASCGPPGSDECLIEPTIFDCPSNSTAIAQEEIFGPVVCVIGFDTEEEAIAIANDSQYGLSGGVFSQDPGRAYRIAMQLRTGGVLINGGGGRLNPSVPFGGYKRSGIGREYGEEGLNEYLEIKVIDFRAA